MEKNPYEKNKYLEKHQHLNVSQAELERKWRLYEEEQEQMKLMMSASAPGNAYSVPFISTWKTDNTSTGSSNSNQVRLPLMPNGSYNFYVNWGDGTVSSIAAWNQPEATHTYAAIGTYTITITGYINGWSFAAISPATGATGDRLKLLTITQWGCLQFNSIITDPLFTTGAFYNCTNLTLLTVSDTPNFKGSPSLFQFFRGCTALTTINNINSWDVSGVTYFRGMFRDCVNFNDNLGNWDVSNATELGFMFYGSSTVSPYGIFTNGGSDSIKNWDVSKVENFSAMFFNQPLFNQEVGLWDVGSATNMLGMFGCTNTNNNVLGTFDNAGSSSINNWNVSNVTDMSQLFQMQRNFNQNIGSWDVSKVTNFASMFFMNTSITNSFNNAGSPSINNWNTSSATNMSYMFNYGTAFNQPINNWNMVNNTRIDRMFQGAGAFNQLVSNWNISNVTNTNNFMLGRTNLNYSAANYDALLIGWASRPVKPNLSINFGTIKRTAASTSARAVLTGAPNNWTIVDGGI
jgi:surface protein